MKSQTILLSALSIGLVAVSARAQTPSGDQFGAAATAGKAKLDTSQLAPVKLVSSLDASGKSIVVLSGPRISGNLAQQKVVARLASEPLSLALTNAKAAKAGTAMTRESRPGSAARADTLVVSAPRRPATTTFSANPLGASIERQVFVGDLPRGTSAASRGLPAGTVLDTVTTATGETAIGPNGFPILLDTSVAQSGTNPIGPNGFPEPLTTGPQAGIQPIGPDGFPTLTTPAFAQTGVTRAGVPRDATAPIPTAVGRGATASAIAAPNAATAVMSGPAAGAGTATTSPQ